jgi:hypothetical protein
MKLLAAMSVFGMMASSAAMADHSAAITTEGINVYTITQKGVDLVKGSPYVLPQPGVAYPLTPQLIAISPAHDFLYVVYELLPFQGNPTEDVTVVGFAITDQGLVKKWSYPLNMDPAEYVNIALDVGLDTVIQYYRPGNDNRYAIITNEQGTTIATDGSYEPGTNEDHLVSGLTLRNKIDVGAGVFDRAK